MPFRRTFVSVSTTTVAVPRVFHARPQRFDPVTLMARDAAEALVSLPFSTTVTFGLQLGPVGDGLEPVAAGVPVVSGFPFPGGGAATALEPARPTTQRPTANTLSFI